MNKEKTYYWPLWFSKLLSDREQRKIKKILPKIQNAQTFLWRALNIYDDFLDNEGKKEELPLANNYFRRYLKIHYQLNLPDDYYKLFGKIMDDLEKADIKEALMPRLKIKNNLIISPGKIILEKNLSKLSNKSLALALGPLALLFFLDYKSSDKKIKAGISFFKYALAAKQLADDSYDWLEDLKNGFITEANLPVIKALNKRKDKINLKRRKEILYVLFAKESSPLIISWMEDLCQKARKKIKIINDKPDNILLANLIVPLEKSCRDSKKFNRLVLEA